MRPLRYKNPLLCLVVAMFALSSTGAFANDDLDVTMRMVTDDETLTDSVVREIRLNRPIGFESGPEAKANGIAEEAREQGRAFGQGVADRAREASRLRNEAKDAPAPDSPESNRQNPGKPETGRP